jgi:pimeloyl-ACP methyl ester carboxylesterase
VLLLHGGPGASFEYVDGLAEEIGAGFQVAAYQQRGLEPSTLEGPFAVEREVADALAVLDALDWARAWVVGHSWGGLLLLHIAVVAPVRLDGGLAVDTLGAVADGGFERFEAEMLKRIPEGDRQLAEQLDEQAMRGDGGPEAALESMRLFWPAYFASPDRVMAFPDTRVSVPAYAGLLESLATARPRLESALAGLEMPLGFLAGACSPMPYDLAAGATARAIPTAWLEVVEGAGHFPWFERPGCVRSALQRLTGTS